MKIQLLNKISAVGLSKLDSSYVVGEDVQCPDGILVRSAPMHEMEFAPNTLAIARAGAGVNNIPIDRCSAEGIVVFNTPGANANGVKELALCALLLASRDVVGGIEWTKGLAGTADVAKQVEKGKSQFVGHELLGKTLGVIGLGAIGGRIASTAVHLGMEVIGCDPYLSVEGAWNLDRQVHRAATYDEIYENADYITLHVPSTGDTKGMIGTESIAKMKNGVKLINLARADLVDTEALREALEDGRISTYVTDFPTEEILKLPHVVAIPHLGASTEESEDNSAIMAARQLDDYLKNGSIRNSINYPSVDMPRNGSARVCVLHANVPSVLSGITTALSNEGINIESLANQSKGNNAYTLLDVTPTPSPEAIKAIRRVEGVVRVRVI